MFCLFLIQRFFFRKGGDAILPAGYTVCRCNSAFRADCPAAGLAYCNSLSCVMIEAFHEVFSIDTVKYGAGNKEE